MSARSESWSPPGSGRRAATAALAGIALLALAWGLLHRGFYDDVQIVDTPVYERYGEALAEGRVPYRDFALEYPPAALPAFYLPTLARGADYDEAFDLLMLACGLAAVVFVALALAELGASSARLAAGTSFAALAPLALGSVVLTRYDLWPAALTTGALAALLAGRERLGLAALALAVGAKGYPLVLLPLALVHVARRRDRRRAMVALAVFVAVLAAVLVPFAALAPDGLRASFERQGGRPLQIESLGSALLLGAHQLGLYAPRVVTTYGSQNLVGDLPDALAAVQTILQLVAIAVVWIAFARGRGGREGLVAAAAAALVAFVAFAKVLSPQFLIWLLPLVPLVGGGAGLLAGALLAAALVLTQAWFPFRYWDVVALGRVGWLVLARDLVLLALFAVLLAATRRERERGRSA
ncbi:MAG: glycosyltransferase 87 family protein [Actinomycetota bacterium]|nr:glycosyltransferase 87 family protein [Actinomycetota bacterium]